MNPTMSSVEIAMAHDNSQAAAPRIGMTDSRQWAADDQARHTMPQDATVLAARRQHAMPKPPRLEPKNPQSGLIAGHCVRHPPSIAAPKPHLNDFFIHTSPVLTGAPGEFHGRTR